MTVVVRSLWRRVVAGVAYQLTLGYAGGCIAKLLTEPEKVTTFERVFAWVGVALLAFHLLWRTVRFTEAETEDASGERELHVRSKSQLKSGKTTVNLIRPARVVDTTIRESDK